MKATIAGKTANNFAKTCPGGTSVDRDPPTPEYFGGREVKNVREDAERTEEGEEKEDVKQNEDKEAGEEARKKADRQEEEEMEKSNDGEEQREKARTKGDAVPEAETDREQHREEPTSRRPCHVLGGTRLHKVWAYLSKRTPFG
ncbi:hypothetical protein NDU88_006037 [Pleurodeles waltl]|uniref:Uncharacterized protein n=1 Tax=Pleurodeles waltl TaxID=8319 RepID=A0AAV7WZL3_PLEWA|nr:hypothetical protein NDU88_006037 [Pleurodeles waltl]